MQVRWHSSADDIPQDCPVLYIAHEFFDALPVHQFQRTDFGWREILVDAASGKSQQPFRFVLAPGTTPASHLLLPRRLEALSASQSEPLNTCTRISCHNHDIMLSDVTAATCLPIVSNLCLFLLWVALRYPVPVLMM